MSRAVPEGALVLIEEIETGLHPGAQRRLVAELMRTALERHVQFIVTTHSPVILEAIPSYGRILLVRRQGAVTVEYGVTPTYALAAMSETVLPELTMYVEDDVAASLLWGALPYTVRKRVRTMQVGSWEAVAGQIAAHRADQGLPPAMACVDGDVSEADFLRVIRQRLGRNWETADTGWVRSRLSWLPGKCPPEQWIITECARAEVRSRLASELACPVADIADVLDSLSPTDPHDVFYVVASQIGGTRNDVQRQICVTVARENETAFAPVVAAIEALLKPS